MDKRGNFIVNLKTNRAQVTIFVIVALVVVALVILIVSLYKPESEISQIPSTLEPVYVSFLSCLQDSTLTGIKLLESQGGYLELPDFEAGSSYMPFSSQLDFGGNKIPYWYYVSGNGIEREQVPTKEEMEIALADFIEKRALECNLDNYLDSGFYIERGWPEAEVSIKEDKVEVDLKMDLTLKKGNSNYFVQEHEFEVNSYFGGLYDAAQIVYQKEQSDLFLEDYAIDVLRLYAPVDGVEFSCSPLIWSAEEIFADLQDAIDANTFALKNNGEEDDYFVLDLDVDENVRFLSSQNWPYSFEVNPSEGIVLKAMPVGNQPGLGILGFCYVAYHFVYDVKYPVLVQIENQGEYFQFPMAVVIEGNLPRESAELSSAIGIETTDFCDYKTIETKVSVYDYNARKIDAEISYECSNTFCRIGVTSEGVYEGLFPQCVGGRILVKADGFVEQEVSYSTLESGKVDVLLKRIYDLDVLLNLDGEEYEDYALINFISNDSSTTIVYPEQKEIELSQGEYEVEVMIYSDSNLKLVSDSMEQCVEVPKGGIGGLFGLTEEKCFDVEIPEQEITNALTGGGKANIYVLENTLKNSEKIEINADSLPIPNTLEQLQDNYILFEDKTLDVNFK